jgi:hypothetical protein
VKIVKTYSHLNGLEFLLVHERGIWDEIQSIISTLDASACLTKISKEKRTMGQMFYSPIAMNAKMKTGFQALLWKPEITTYWVTDDAKLIRRTLALPAAEQNANVVGRCLL